MCQHVVVLDGCEVLLSPNQGRQLVQVNLAVGDGPGATEGSLGHADLAERVPAQLEGALTTVTFILVISTTFR